MNITPEIIFHGCDRSMWVEQYIDERLQWLDKHAGGDISSASVRVGCDQSSKSKANLYSVKVEVRIAPAITLVATKEREIQDMQTELRALIRQAFEAVNSQLDAAVEKRRNDVKSHSLARTVPPPPPEESAPL